MAPPTKAQIADLITRYIAYARNDAKPDLKLIGDIVRFYGSFPNPGNWEWDDTPGKSVVSCFQGISFICWRFSSVNSSANAVDAVTLYKDLTLQNYNVWASMTDLTKKENFRRDCSALTDTDTLKDYQQITWDKKVQRAEICEAAMTVTSAMYGSGTPQADRSEALWNNRNANQNA
ncbi:hypothetical protein E1B28_008010 [Marasmius oreades]|uniref:Uncharacterized protein n=1 Tax=Marasmius oreades TaxID=181124 RepID=A0A9P7UVI7_9AGAR|nr:uncharacterized protein E1B28_008010 [Marasmius oreades]KAG7094411.1 hypothetical protein E1B28_008010 [Marasmius oreades]